MDEFDAADPRDPKEIAEHIVASTAYDAIACLTKLLELRNDPIASRYVAAEPPALWEVKCKTDLLISEIRETSKPKLVVV